MASFCETVWEETAGLRRAILDLPFVRELTAGTLGRERFRFYMIQDALYLERYSRALAIASAKAPDADAMERFAQSARNALIVERVLHGGFLETFGVDPKEASAMEPSPTCAGYTNFLLTVAHIGGYEELTAAVLPCFRIYWDVGGRIRETAAPDNPYQAWIDTYSDADFGERVAETMTLVDRAAAGAGPATRQAMRRAYIRASQYEWMFWDSAYRLERWPVAA